MAFQDRITEHPGRIILTAVSGETDTYDVTPAEGTVTQAGTPLTAANLNAQVVSLIASHIKQGVVTPPSTPAGGVTDISITFTTPMASTPAVLLTFQTTSSAANFGNCNLAALNRSANGFTIRFYNNGTATRSPGIRWLATDL